MFKNKRRGSTNKLNYKLGDSRRSSIASSRRSSTSSVSRLSLLRERKKRQNPPNVF
eukprot:UN01907